MPVRQMLARQKIWPIVALGWGVLLTLYYIGEVLSWVPPSKVKWVLPFIASSRAPDFAFLLTQIVLFASGLFGFLAAGYGAGLASSRFLRFVPVCRGRAIPLGLAVLAAILLGLGLTGLWFRTLFLAVLIPFTFAGLLSLRNLWRLRCRDEFGIWRSRELVIPAAVIGVIVLLACLSPVVFQDAMRYHLFVPGQFLLEHKFFFIEGFFYWSYMGPTQMLYGAALALAGDPAAKGANVLFALLSFAALMRVARLIGLARPDRALLLALTLTAPGTVLVSSFVFAENALGLYVLLAAEALFAGETIRRSDLRRFALFFAVALSVKYTAVLAGVGIALVLLGKLNKSGRNFLCSPGVLASLALPLLPWLFLRWEWTGDPLSPILSRWRIPGLDISSGPALEKAYAFAHQARAKYLSDPGSLLLYPVSFTGAHGGFWEHPGPAIPALAIGTLLVLARLPRPFLFLLLFTSGSFAAWLVLLGGASAHYVAGFIGIWTAGFLASLNYLPGWKATILRNCLVLAVFVQCVGAAGTVMMFVPSGVAGTGALQKDECLSEVLEPAGVHHPVRRELDSRFPRRGTVYVYGDETSYHLRGRARVDYEDLLAPLLRQLAEKAHHAHDLRKKLRQRNITHLLYSSRWPDAAVDTGRAEPFLSERALNVLQDFWRSYARPLVVHELRSSNPENPALGENLSTSCVFRFLSRPREREYAVDFTSRLPFIPGTEEIVGEGDRLLEEGLAMEAWRFYVRQKSRRPNFVLLDDRLARASAQLRNRSAARRHFSRMAARGWTSTRLRNTIERATP